MTFVKYTLTEDQIKGIANLCLQEQGNLEGLKAQASLAANLLETKDSYKRKYGKDIYSFMRNSGWFSRAAYWMDNGYSSKMHRDAVKDVLCNGNRTLPIFVDEHDCFSDIRSVTNNGTVVVKNVRSNYIQDVSVIKNTYGSIYKFWCFPTPTSDPFGYTNTTLRKKWEEEQQKEEWKVENVNTFIRDMYVSELYRQPSENEIKSWVDKIKNGMKYNDVLNTFRQADEGKKAWITLMYKMLLDRKPDQQGMQTWLREMKNGKTRADILKAFVNSKEYKEKHKR